MLDPANLVVRTLGPATLPSPLGLSTRSGDWVPDYVPDDLRVQIVALNHDSLETHEEFSRKYKFPFPLCSDADRRVSASYGALLELWKLRRVLVLVGDDGRIWWRHRVLRAFYKNATDLEQVIRELQRPR